MSAAEPLTAERLRAVLHYDERTGHFTNLARRRGATVGARTGAVGRDGYLYIKIDGRVFAAHRLVWLYVHGVWPPVFIDHINHNPLDNRLCNLRLATVAENARNRQSPPGHRGYRGVNRRAAGSRPWVAYIGLGRKQIHLGYHATAEAAARTYDDKARELFGAFAVLNFPEQRDAA